MKFSKKMGRIKMSGIRKMFDMAKEDSVHLGLGEPDFQPPEHVIQAMKDALDQGHNKYGPTNGIPALRQAIADDLNKTFEKQGKRVGFDGKDKVTPDNIIVTSSGTEALGTITRVMFEAGDEVWVMPAQADFASPFDYDLFPTGLLMGQQAGLSSDAFPAAVP